MFYVNVQATSILTDTSGCKTVLGPASAAALREDAARFGVAGEGLYPALRTAFNVSLRSSLSSRPAALSLKSFSSDNAAGVLYCLYLRVSASSSC